MRRTNLARALLLAAVALAGAPRDARPCQGSSVPVPNCPRTIWLAKSINRVIVQPPPNTVIQVPIGVLGFVSWNTLPPCAQPSGASLTIQLICTPVRLGNAINLPIQNFPAPTPTVPGLQTNLANNGVAVYQIAANTLDPTEAYSCQVIGVYTVDFPNLGTGLGSGPISATGDTEVCIVPPVPGQPGIPRLDLRLLEPPGELFRRCAPGDQTIHHFLLRNNDRKRPATLTLTSEGRQVAGLPDGANPADAAANYDAGLYAISSVTPGTDTFAAAFLDPAGGAAASALLPEPDPAVVSTIPLTRTHVLPPLGAAVVSIAMRSHGMCANGSCNERFLKVEGTFSDGGPALGCAQVLLVVDTVAPKSRLCEISDFMKCGPTTIAGFTPTVFKNAAGMPIPNARTFSAGNVHPNQGVGTQLYGQMAGPPVVTGPTFAPQATDFIRTTQTPMEAAYSFYAQDQQRGKYVQNDVTVRFGSNPTGAQLPLIGDVMQPTSFFDIFVDVDLDALEVRPHGVTTPLYDGTFSGFEQSPPFPLYYDPQTCRAFGFDCAPLTAKTIATMPLALLRSFRAKDLSPCLGDLLRVIDAQSGSLAPYSATVQGPGISLPQASSITPAPIVIETELLSLDLSGGGGIAVNWVGASCPGALNAPLQVPVVTVVDETGGSAKASASTKATKAPWKGVAAGGTYPAQIMIANKSKGVLSFHLGAITGPFGYLRPDEQAGLRTLGRGETITIDLFYAPPNPKPTEPTRGTHRGTLELEICSKTKPTMVKLKGTFGS